MLPASLHLEWLPFFTVNNAVSWLTLAVFIGLATALWLKIRYTLSTPLVLGRLVIAAAIITLLLGPRLTQQEQRPLPNIVLALVDETTSNTLIGRSERTKAAIERLTAQIGQLENTELRLVPFAETAGDSALQPALNAGLAAVPSKQLAGVVAIGDADWRQTSWRQADIVLPEKVPFTVLNTNNPKVTDRRLDIAPPPTFVHVDKPFKLTVTVQDPDASGPIPLTIAMNGEEVTLVVEEGSNVDIPLTIRRAGPQQLLLSVPPRDGEITPINNKKLITINGLRDRLQVLLVSGQPHPGGRELRALLRNDPNVDLIHFTILRSPKSLDLTPSRELALVPFPVQELFQERVGDFDLIIMDRFQRNGVLNGYYLNQIAEKANALLVIAAEETADLALEEMARQLLLDVGGDDSLQEVKPQLADTRHPITLPLRKNASGNNTDWGNWLVPSQRSARRGDTLLETLDGQPLLQIGALHAGYSNRERRLAQLASNYTWLWRRADAENDGPQQQLMQRLISWLLKDQALEPQDLALIPNQNGLIAAATISAIATLPTAETVSIDPTNAVDNQTLTPSTVPSTLDERFTYQPLGDNIGIYTLAERDNPKNVVYAQQGLDTAEWRNLGNNSADTLDANTIITLANNAAFSTGYWRQDVTLQRRQAIAIEGASKIQRWFWPCLALLTVLFLFGRWRTER